MLNRITRWIVAGLAACLLGAIPGAQQPDARVDLRVDGRTLDEVVQYLREQSGANIVVLGGGEKEISLELTDVAWREALELAAELAACVVVEGTGGVLTVEEPQRVTFRFEDQDIREVISTIAALADANIVIAPDVAGTITLNLTDVPWRDALSVAVKTLGYTVVEEDRGILRVVDPLSLQAQMETRFYQFRFIRPRGSFAPVIESEFVDGRLIPASGELEKDFPVIPALRKALSQGGDLDYVPSHNGVIVRDTAQVHSAVQDIVTSLDIEPSQVFIDVKFVTTTNEDVLNIGVDYGDGGPQVGINGGQIPISLPFDLGSGGWDDLIIASPSGDGPFVGAAGNGGGTFVPDTIFGALSFTGVSATIRMLQRDSRTEIVQAPKLLALDGDPATIFVGETIRYAEAKTEQGQAGGLELSVQEADNSPVEVGFQLMVVPHIIPGTNKLTMEVIPKETSLSGIGDTSIAPPGFDVFTIGASGLEGTIALPRRRSSTIVTSMILESGQPVMVGGLSTEQEQESFSEVPYLADIPWLGELFQHEDRTTTRRSLMVFITPTIIRSSSDTQRMLETELQMRREEFGDRLRTILYGPDSTAMAPASYDSEPVAISQPPTTFVAPPPPLEEVVFEAEPAMETPAGPADSYEGELPAEYAELYDPAAAPIEPAADEVAAVDESLDPMIEETEASESTEDEVGEE
ncbi:MAG: hypothetical protein AAF682_13680 [Planctomycetota bacterium]